MIYLRELVKRSRAPEGPDYPLCSAVLRGFSSLSFSRPVTILCGENGSGKSTLMSLMAAGLSAQAVGGQGVQAQKLKAFRQAARHFQFIRSRSPRSCFLFTAEDFSRYLDQRQSMADEAREGLRAVREGFEGRSAYARGLASQPFARTLGELETQYDRELLSASHGEGFLSFFAGRLGSGGLYLMDEPEGALSCNQLSAGADRPGGGRRRAGDHATHSPCSPPIRMPPCSGWRRAAWYELRTARQRPVAAFPRLGGHPGAGGHQRRGGGVIPGLRRP